MIVVAVLLLALVSISIELTVLYNVRRQVTRGGEQIQAAVEEAIATAKRQVVADFGEAIGPALGKLVEVVPAVLGQVLDSRFRVSGGGTVEVSTSDGETTVLKAVPDSG